MGKRPAAPGPGGPRSRGRGRDRDLSPGRAEQQDVPYRLRELLRSRELMRSRQGKRRRRAERKPKPAAQDDIPVPKFKRRKREPEAAFVRRMEQEARHVLFLTQNQLQRQPEKQEPAREKPARKKEFWNKRLDKFRKKKAEKKAAMLEQTLLQDPVKFGEVALQPPVLTARPRKSTDKAGQKRLLLTSLLGPGHVPPMPKPAPVSLARQRILEEERERVILAYRRLKKLKQQQQQPEPSPGRPGKGTRKSLL
ncbi:coiled-coil domain-containing protein 137 [Alligator mississippiensis]|uniref:Coiled-coil domain-containing protein 137 n=1 Tax=Alligator mississippiensis TaxID=8496 RepID=A0A151MJN9_ALLMI|nr:coiled-coil domain-containing protein 137 [Alligator mississippiensis]